MSSLQPAASTLSVVATPIGNLEDLSQHAIATLQSVDLILCEDTRHSRKLLQAYQIGTPLQALHEHNEQASVQKLIERLQAGQRMALISDAGTPLISDPGYRLVRACHQHALQVLAVPGPCAAMAALSVAGLPSDQFCFIGFLPHKAAARSQRLQALAQSQATLIFYESPKRLLDTVRAMREVCGDQREIAHSRELTKAFEITVLTTLAELEAGLLADPDQQRGEHVLLLAGMPASASNAAIPPAVIALHKALCEHLPPRQAAGLLASHLGVNKNDLYAVYASNS